MESLSQKDMRAILDFLQDIYGLQTFEAFAGKLLSGLLTIVDADSSVCLESGGEEEYRIRFSVSEISHLVQKLYPVWSRVRDDHPGWGELVESGGTAWCTLSDYLSETAYHRTGLYNELWRHMDIEENIGTVCQVSPGRVVGISLHRDRRTFTSRDRLALSLIQPHLRQAWRNNQLAGSLAEEMRSETMRESHQEGVVVLDTRRRVRVMTTKARLRIEKYFGRLGGDDRLPEALHSWVRHQTSMLERSAAGGVPDSLVLQGSGDAELKVTLAPDPAGATLIVQESASICDLTPLGLTRRESDVLLWVTRGKSNEEIGMILTMSLGTVKKHLEHVFQKLGVENRTSAATTAMTRLRDPLAL